MTPPVPATSDLAGRVRNAVSAALITMVVAGEVVALGELLGVRWPSLRITLGLALGVVPLLVASFRFRASPPGPAYARGVAAMLPLWGLWGLGYFVVAAITDPARTRVLDEGLVAHLP